MATYSLKAKALEPERKLLDDIYNCEFLGFLDPGRKRVGCLLHPAVNDGRDLRDLCFYGRELCSSHLCPSYSHLTEEEKLGVIEALDDWYAYGLVITDIDLVKEFFKHAENLLGEPVKARLLKHPGPKAAMRSFFELKVNWRFSSRESRLGKYYFSYAEYGIARIEYEKNWGIQPSRFDRILVSLASDFHNETELLEAEDLIERRIREFVGSYQLVSSKGPLDKSPVGDYYDGGPAGYL